MAIDRRLIQQKIAYLRSMIKYIEEQHVTREHLENETYL